MPATPDDIPVGRIAGAFGVHGELKCDPTSAGRMLFSAGRPLLTRFADGATETVELASVREHKGRLLIRIHGCAGASEAQRFSGATLFAPAADIRLDAGEFLDRDLCGCEVFDRTGRALGRVERVEHYPSSDMLVVRGELVPMVDRFITSIDVAAKKVVVDLPDGLLDGPHAP